MAETARDITLHFAGVFRVTDQAGGDLTPRGAKAQALLALLALGPSMARTRIWLQDKLWSTRGREQGAASLRQSLSEIRRAFGDHADALLADRARVALDPAIVAVEGTEAPGETFLEGIDIGDPEFEDWLSAERARRAGQDSARFAGTASSRRQETGAPMMVLALAEPGGTPLESLFAEVFISNVAISLREQFTVDVVSDQSLGGIDGRIALTIRARGVFSDGMAMLHAAVEEGPARVRIWGSGRQLPARGAPPLDHDDMLQLANECIDAVSEALSLADNRRVEGDEAAVLLRQAIGGIFSMSLAEQLAADDLLASAFALEPRGSYLAWRVFLRVVLMMERQPVCAKTLREEIVFHAAEAMRLEPMNSMVLAAVAYAELLVNGNVAAGYALARRAVGANPANPFGWLALCTSQIYAGNPEQAHQYMLRARRIGSTSPFRHWWDMGCSLTATVTGRLDQAIWLAETAGALAPGFKPPLRYLAALYTRKGDFEAARAAAQRLKEIEPDFMPERLMQDDAYPAAALRLSGIVSDRQLREIT